MRLLYGVVGEGLGHATRSVVVIEHLLARGHELRVVVSGKAHAMMSARFAGRAGVRLDEIAGLELVLEGNEVDKSETAWKNLESLPHTVRRNVDVYRRVAEDAFAPEAVVSDFESWAYLYGLNHFLPVVSIDNMQVINRCRHDDDVTGGGGLAFRFTRTFVKLKLPGAYHYVATSFFFPPVRKPRTTLVPPILRPEILSARRERGRHVLVYQKASALAGVMPLLQKLPHEFRLYGAGRTGREGNVTMQSFSETGFVDDLRTARAVIAPGGYSLMGEAVHLRVPMLAIPLEGQYEQELNSRYLDRLGYGRRADALDEAALVGFLEDLDRHEAALATYTPRGNELLFGCVDELLARIAAGEGRPDRLDAPAMGKWEEAEA